jgi:DNA-binding transcriptional LysR family regulator
MNDLAATDLNLLVAFDALMEARSVTRAAHAVGLSQPAMSNALARLRATFGDALFVRAPGGLAPTPRALQAHPKVKEALSAIGAALGRDSTFDPATDRRRFRVAMAENAAYYLLPATTASLASAPNIEIQVLTTGHVPGVELVRSDQAEASVGQIATRTSKELRSQRLFRERLVCLISANHPAARSRARKMDLEEFVAARHVTAQPSLGVASQVDDELARIGKRRRIAYSIAHFMVAPYLLTDPSLIACLPSRLAQAFAKQLGFVVKEAPIDLPPYDAWLTWHRRFDQDPGHRWLRTTFIRAAATLD